jgi:hypothetical protein
VATKELLRVAMNEKQVQQACEDWARSRSRVDGAGAYVELTFDPGPSLFAAEVVFSKKRERKAPKVAGP